MLGAGAWGRAFAKALSDNTDIVFWDKTADTAKSAAHSLGAGYQATITQAVQGCQVVVVAVSSQGFSTVLQQIPDTDNKIIVWLTKGFDPQTHRPLFFTAQQILGAQGRFAVISGPSFAKEVEQSLPTALELCANVPTDLPLLQQLFHRRHLRIYPNSDMVAVSVGGTVKNIIAIAAGVCDALALGANARAALIARGMKEMSALCVALGGQQENLLGLSGLGDLVLTCTSTLSRNYQLGYALGQTPQKRLTATDIEGLQQQTCEGVYATFSVYQCGLDYGLTLPIIAAVHQLLNGQLSAGEALTALLQRNIAEQ